MSTKSFILRNCVEFIVELKNWIFVASHFSFTCLCHQLYPHEWKSMKRGIIMKGSGLSNLLLISLVAQSYSYTFTTIKRAQTQTQTQTQKFTRNLQKYNNYHPSSLYAFTPSKVDDDDEPTPTRDLDSIKEIDASTVPGLHYSKDAHPIPSQPWRRGDTDGCEDPIYTPWRQEAEKIIHEACKSVGATVEGVTWSMSQCIISLEDFSEVEGIIDGPEVIISSSDDYDEQLGPDLSWNPSLSEEEFKEYIDTHPRSQVETLDDPMHDIKLDIDTTSLSAVAGAIVDALSEPSVEARLRVISRHEIILSQSSGMPGVLETQKDFDAHRGKNVSVETRDPFKSNRTLQGKLVARTALDVIINVDDNLVTIPSNFVYQVKLDDSSHVYDA